MKRYYLHEEDMQEDPAGPWVRVEDMEEKFCEGCGWWKTPRFNMAAGECSCLKLYGATDEEDDELCGDGDNVWTGPKFGCVHWKDKE